MNKLVRVKATPESNLNFDEGKVYNEDKIQTFVFNEGMEVRVTGEDKGDDFRISVEKLKPDIYYMIYGPNVYYLLEIEFVDQKQEQLDS